MRADVSVMTARRTAALLAIASIAGCGGGNTPASVDSPGEQQSVRSRALETGADVLQGKAPLSQFNVYLNGFHFANGRPDEQNEAEQYCEVVDNDFRQCVLFDGNGGYAKLIGIEYVISRRVFEQLPMLERTLWHSHAYDVSSGLLIGPGLPEAVEHKLMEQLAATYGKTWHTWHSERDDALPVGIPALMAGFTGDDQIEPRRVQDRDRRFGIETSDRRLARGNIEAPGILPGADAWQFGEPMQLMLHPVAAASPAMQEQEPEHDEGIQAPLRRSPESRRRDVFADLALARQP